MVIRAPTGSSSLFTGSPPPLFKRINLVILYDASVCTRERRSRTCSPGRINNSRNGHLLAGKAALCGAACFWSSSRKRKRKWLTCLGIPPRPILVTPFSRGSTNLKTERSHFLLESSILTRTIKWTIFIAKFYNFEDLYAFCNFVCLSNFELYFK